MRLSWRRKPRELAMAAGVHPLTGTVRTIRPGEVMQARADAQAEFDARRKSGSGPEMPPGVPYDRWLRSDA